MQKSLLEDPLLREYIEKTYPETIGLRTAPEIQASRLRTADLEMFSAKLFYDVLPTSHAYRYPETVLRRAGVIRPGAKVEVSKHQPPGRGKFVEIKKEGRLEIAINLLDPKDTNRPVF